MVSLFLSHRSVTDCMACLLYTSGNAGAGVQVKIRGVKTFGDNQPLYIIDGFPGDIDVYKRQVQHSLHCPRKTLNSS